MFTFIYFLSELLEIYSYIELCVSNKTFYFSQNTSRKLKITPDILSKIFAAVFCHRFSARNRFFLSSIYYASVLVLTIYIFFQHHRKDGRNSHFYFHTHLLCCIAYSDAKILCHMIQGTCPMHIFLSIFFF